MLFRIKSYLQFLWRATNEHGVHSPFVFALVTQCFYNKSKTPEYGILKAKKTTQNTTKKTKLLFRISHYFKPENVLGVGIPDEITTLALSLGNPKAKITTLSKNSPTETLETASYNLIYFGNNLSKTTILDYLEQVLPTITNETLWLFDAVHRSSDAEEVWETIKKHPQVRVTVDTFIFGLVFFRKEQAKEHFVIRV